jgi:hypothetical protein
VDRDRRLAQGCPSAYAQINSIQKQMSTNFPLRTLIRNGASRCLRLKWRAFAVVTVVDVRGGCNDGNAGLPAARPGFS